MSVGSGISVVLLLLAVRLRFWISPPPAEMPVRVIVRGVGVGLFDVNSRIGAGLAMPLIVGASLTGMTVIERNALPTLLLGEPSSAENCTVRGSDEGLSLRLK